jgi:hypothetical protein
MKLKTAPPLLALLALACTAGAEPCPALRPCPGPGRIPRCGVPWRTKPPARPDPRGPGRRPARPLDLGIGAPLSGPGAAQQLELRLLPAGAAGQPETHRRQPLRGHRSAAPNALQLQAGQGHPGRPPGGELRTGGGGAGAAGHGAPDHSCLQQLPALPEKVRWRKRRCARRRSTWRWRRTGGPPGSSPTWTFRSQVDVENQRSQFQALGARPIWPGHLNAAMAQPIAAAVEPTTAGTSCPSRPAWRRW